MPRIRCVTTYEELLTQEWRALEEATSTVRPFDTFEWSTNW